MDVDVNGRKFGPVAQQGVAEFFDRLRAGCTEASSFANPDALGASSHASGEAAPPRLHHQADATGTDLAPHMPKADASSVGAQNGHSESTAASITSRSPVSKSINM